MAAPDFWSNRERAQADVEEVSRLRSLTNPFQELEREIEDFSALQQLAAEESDPPGRPPAKKELPPDPNRRVHRLKKSQFANFLPGGTDHENELLTFIPGPGARE